MEDAEIFTRRQYVEKMCHSKIIKHVRRDGCFRSLRALGITASRRCLPLDAADAAFRGRPNPEREEETIQHHE